MIKASSPKDILLSSSLRALSCVSCCSQRPCSLWTYKSHTYTQLPSLEKKKSIHLRWGLQIFLTSSLCSFLRRSSSCRSLSFCWASSFSLCKISWCSWCWGLKEATRRGEPGAADPRTVPEGCWADWTTEGKHNSIRIRPYKISIDTTLSIPYVIPICH